MLAEQQVVRVGDDGDALALGAPAFSVVIAAFFNAKNGDVPSAPAFLWLLLHHFSMQKMGM
jgi:hypothetical protein